MADSGHDEILNILDLKPKHKKKIKLFSLTLLYGFSWTEGHKHQNSKQRHKIPKVCVLYST